MQDAMQGDQHSAYPAGERRRIREHPLVTEAEPLGDNELCLQFIV